VKRSTTYVIGIAVILGFLGLGYGEWQRSMTTYVSFADARTSKVPVQVKGELLKDRTVFDEKTGNLVFRLKDKGGSEMEVVYSGSKPGNFDQASHVVAVGRYDGGHFRADRLLVKCPSKYQGQVKPE
jgi:cytochrome c-type biogenesis protein CcmE